MIKILLFNYDLYIVLQTKDNIFHNAIEKHYEKLVFLGLIGAILTMIVDSNFLHLVGPKSNHTIGILPFVIYSIIFVYNIIILLRYVKSIDGDFHPFNIKQLHLPIIISFSFIVIGLSIIIVDISFFSYYEKLLKLIIIFGSSISSLFILSIVSIKFLSWLRYSRNRMILLYSLVFIVFCTSIVFGLMYIIHKMAQDPNVMKPISLRMFYAIQDNANPVLNSQLSTAYDIVSILSFGLAWLVTVFILKQYAGRVGKITFWVLASLPLIYFFLRYQILVYVILSNLGNTDLYFIVNSIKLGIPQYQFINEILINSNLQLGGIFFGIAFLYMANRLRKNSVLRNSLTISLIGLIFIFGSKDIYSLQGASYPPLGLVSICYMMLGSYLLYVSITTFARIAARDNEFRNVIYEKAENALSFLNKIADSERNSLIEKTTLSLFEYSNDWKKTNNSENLNDVQIKEIIQEIVKELENKERK